MRKSWIIGIIIAVVIILAVSLLVYNVFFKPPSEANGFKEYNLISYVDNDTIEYQGQRYIEKDSDFIEIIEKIIENNIENLSLISWNYSLHLSTVSYYSHTDENPDYILCDTGSYKTVYFKESFDCEKEVFAIEGTEIEVVYSDTFKYRGFFTDKEEYEHFKTYHVYMKSHPELRTELNIYVKNDTNYMFTLGADSKSKEHVLSESFLNILIEQGIIEQQ